jgi:hypothetical protein
MAILHFGFLIVDVWEAKFLYPGKPAQSRYGAGRAVYLPGMAPVAGPAMSPI